MNFCSNTNLLLFLSRDDRKQANEANEIAWIIYLYFLCVFMCGK